MTELHDLTALEQGAMIRNRQVSAVEFAEHYLRRSEGSRGAFVRMTPDLALSQARAADDRIRHGESGMGPLFGVVCPVKDLDDVAGVPTRYGSVIADQRAARDSNVVTAMREAGLVFTGKTNTPEFGLPCYTEPEPEVAPPARCPWDPQRTAGGSSGGAALAVAAGLAPIAQGSDGGGSVRIPASACGLVGIKPTRGRISNGPLPDAVGDLVTMGTLGRTVADAAALLDVMARPFPSDPYWSPPPPDGGFVRAADTDPGRLRIGYFTTPVITDAPAHPEAVRAVEGALAVLSGLGHDIVEVPAPFTPERVTSFEAVWQVLASLMPLAPEQEARLQPLTRYLRSQASGVTGVALGRAAGALRTIAAEVGQKWAGVDVVVSPTVNGPPPLVSDMVDRQDPAVDFDNQKRWAAYTASINITGRPAIGLPLHWTDDGLPVGVQVIGGMFAEALLVSLAAQVERSHPFRRPG